ncbi:magnesium transporter [Miltoncostaea marina]|uniref:magnesium transporter n=1 Tax=Miltoncostaea marina TaxID=2843215 RepID=UPI001C3DBFDF|nr:magnesium transporter [Miltoncostaea marina]
MPDTAAPAVPLDVAGALAVADVPTCSAGDRAGDVRRAMAGRRFESVDALAVLDGARLAGLVRMVDLVAAPDDEPVRERMDADPPRIAPGADQEVAAWRAVRRHEGTMAVVDDDDRFVGLIPPYRLLGVLLREHDEDLARLGGYAAGSRSAREASEERVPRRVWHRLPWLLLGLAGALLAAVIVGRFEDELERNVLLTLFIPGIVYMADAVGTQTEALVIRGLSVGVGIRRIARRELLTGVIVGAVIAAAFVAIGLPAWGDAEVIAAVALALLAACTTATVVAMALPSLFSAVGVDPAFGSGPLATVIQDLLSILIYFSIATVIVG